jgi:hypothetical protein
MNIKSKQIEEEGVGFLKHMNMKSGWTHEENVGYISTKTQDEDEHKKRVLTFYNTRT